MSDTKVLSGTWRRISDDAAVQVMSHASNKNLVMARREGRKTWVEYGKEWFLANHTPNTPADASPEGGSTT